MIGANFLKNSTVNKLTVAESQFSNFLISNLPIIALIYHYAGKRTCPDLHGGRQR